MVFFFGTPRPSSMKALPRKMGKCFPEVPKATPAPSGDLVFWSMAHVPTLGVHQQNHSWWFFTNPIWKNINVKMEINLPPRFGVKIPKKMETTHLEILWNLWSSTLILWSLVSLPQTFFIPPFSAHQRIGICNTCILEQMLGWAILMGFHGQKPVLFGGMKYMKSQTLLASMKSSAWKKNANEYHTYLDVPEVRNWLVNGLYWGCNPLTNLLLTFWTSK